MQVHVVTWFIMSQTSEFGNDPACSVRSTFQHSMFCLQMPSLTLSLSACILYSPSKVNRHRFGALDTARLNHYSKCQLCKWSAVCLSSHIIWVIALWRPYLFWSSIHTLIAYAAISLMLPLQSGYENMLSVHLWHLNERITWIIWSSSFAGSFISLFCILCSCKFRKSIPYFMQVWIHYN